MKKIVESIEVKLKKFITLHQTLEIKKRKLEEESTGLKDRLSQCESDLSRLREEVSILEISKSVSTSQEETKRNRQKINKYVREIDRCIELLNK